MTEPSQVGEVRRAATTLAGQLGFGATEAGKVALVATEASNNLVKHGGGGECFSAPWRRTASPASKYWPSTADRACRTWAVCLRDGYSTAGTPGTGLGAIVRLSSNSRHPFRVSGGTALLARLWSQPLPPGRTRTGLEVSAVSLPYPGESVCGDAWAFEQVSDRGLFLVADGLGHGPLAADAGRDAVRIFRANLHLPLGEIVQAADAALRSTRGAAILVVDVNPTSQKLSCVGVGNISGTIVADGPSRSVVSHNGTVGHAIRKIQEFAFPFPAGALLVLHSDGLATSWRLEQYPGLSARDPALIAGVLYRDFKRGRDDVTVVTAREIVRGPMNRAILSVEIRLEHDVVLARQRARQIAGLLGFEPQDQTRIATAVSEIARNAFQYAGGGRVEFLVQDDTPPVFLIRVHDQGPGIRNLQEILDGRYRSPTGMGLGIVGVRRLMDSFRIESAPGAGTNVVLGKSMSRRTKPLRRRGPGSPYRRVGSRRAAEPV